MEIQSRLIGLYNFNNIQTAVSLGRYFKVPPEKIKAAIENYSPENNRSQILQKESNTFILDAYNANPSSMKQALENFSKMNAAFKTAILGDMLELGQLSDQAHARIGEKMASFGVDVLFTLGERAEIIAQKARDAGMDAGRVVASKDHRQLLLRLKEIIGRGDWILVKGSRAMSMEKIVLGLMGEEG